MAKSIVEQEQGRRERGAALAAAGAATLARAESPTLAGAWLVKSESSPNSYRVAIRDDQVSACGCPDFTRRGGTCKHMAAVAIMRSVYRTIERAEVEGRLSALYGRTVIRLTLSEGWEAQALAALLHAIEGRPAAAPAVAFPATRAPLALAA